MAYTAGPALSAARDAKPSPGISMDYIVNAGSTIYKGAMVGVPASVYADAASITTTLGYAHPFNDRTANKDLFVGIAEESVAAAATAVTGIAYNEALNPDAVTASPLVSRIRVARKGIHRVAFQSDTDTSTAAKQMALIGAPVYASSDGCVSDLSTGTTYYSEGGVKVGNIVAWESAPAVAGTVMYCWIQIDNAVS